jgi:hypothetical protein
MRRFIRSPLFAVTAVCAAVLAAVAVFAASRAGTSIASAPMAPGGGKSLVLIENPGREDAADLLARGVTVVNEFGEGLLAFARPEDIQRLRSSGLAFRVLDTDAAGKTYYTVSLGEEPGAETDLGSGRVLARAGLRAVIEIAPRDAWSLSAEGREIAAVFPTPMRVNPPDDPILPPLPLQADPAISDIVSAVSIGRVSARVQRLQDFASRYSLHDSSLAAAAWIKTRFESFGIDSVYFHEWNADYSPNVVAVLPGVAHPERIVVIGGHYDSITSNMNYCPGADDNASGTACVLECAEVLSRHEFDCTIVFIAFSGEEQGLLGSEAYASAAAARGDDVIAMIAVDMIGYVASQDVLDLDVIKNESSAWLRDRVMGVAATYVPGFPLADGYLTGGTSDHASFWRHGYDALLFIEDSATRSPYIHTANDVVGVSYINETLAEGSVKTAAALVADLARPFRVAIAHTPLANTEDETNPYRVAAKIFSVAPLDPASLVVRYFTDGDWIALGLAPAGTPSEYEAYIPAQPGGTVVSYYIAAADVNGVVARDPEGAPPEPHIFAVGVLTTVFADDFETDKGWTAGAPGDNATGGIWERADPNATMAGTMMIQPEDDHTPAPGVFCFVTGNSPPGASMGDNDVDEGTTTVLSPIFDLSSCPNAWVSYYRWYTNNTGGAPETDTWAVDASSDGGSTWVRMEAARVTARRWMYVEHNLERFIPLTPQVRFRFVASDEGQGSVVEAALDDFLIVTYRSSTLTAVTDDPSRAPRTLDLAQNYPNPFNPSTTIRFSVPAPGSMVSLKVYDVTGRLVATLVDNEKISGARAVRWTAKDLRGADVASGLYFYRLITPDNTISRKLVVVR